MQKLIECVPNFSEGRDQKIIQQITDAIKSAEGAALLDVDPGATTNRTVVTLVGTPEGAVEAGFLDRVAPAPAEELLAEAHKVAAQLKSLHLSSHAATKLRAREHTLRAIHAAIEQDEKLFHSR